MRKFKIITTGLVILLLLQCSTKKKSQFEEYYEQARQEIDNKNYEIAISLLNKAITINGHADTVFTLKAFCYYQIGDFENAFNTVENALKLNSKNDYAYFLRGNSISQIDMFEQLNKDGILNDEKLGYDTLNGKRIERYLIFISSDGKSFIYDNKAGIDDLSKAIQLNNKEADYYYHRGVLYQEIKEKEFALIDLNKALELLPTEAEFYHQRGILYGEMKNYEFALRDYDKAISIKEDPIYYMNRGHLKKSLNDKHGACMDFEKAEKLGHFVDKELRCNE